MEKLFRAVAILALLIGPSLTAVAHEDRRDHDWNDEYWHHHHYGYWHGERGYWRYHDHKHEFIRVGPELGGFRTGIARKGITFNAQYVDEVWGNPTGGESTDTVYTGLISLQGNVDLQKLVGWQGASISTRWYWLNGQDISAKHVGNIFTVSNIAGLATVRMNELWFQQNFLSDRISIRLGQLGADSEFDVSTHSIVFLNGRFGWSPYLSTNIPNGGPGVSNGFARCTAGAYTSKLVNLRGGCLSGQSLCSGRQSLWIPMDLSASNGYFSTHELDLRINQGAKSNGLPGTFKIGGWFDTASDPNANSTQPWSYGFYFGADQMLYRVPAPDPVPVRGDNGKQTAASSLTHKGLGTFAHIGFSPENSSFINFYIDGGLSYKGLIPTRDSDILGVAIAYGHLRNKAQDNEGKSNPDYEIVFEATYQVDVATWLSLQPDLQYVIHPSGTHIANALVLGARTTVSF